MRGVDWEKIVKKKQSENINSDDDTLNIELLAKEHEENQQHAPAPLRPRSNAQWDKLKLRRQNDERWRQTLQKVWKNKKPK